MIRISAVVVLYNPDENIIKNIDSYIDEVEKLYVVDNSDKKSLFLIDEIVKYNKVEYIDNQGNQGIAHALNIGCNKAIDDGYDWILTMDQDSFVPKNMLSIMLNYLDKSENKNMISIVSPFHANVYNLKTNSTKEHVNVLTAMTSGNLLNLICYKKIGPFKEELFIDYVDNDYCLRSNLKGYKVVQVNDAILKHNLGDLKQYKVLWKTFYSTNHSPIRRYYAFRNRINIIKTYKHDFPKYCNFEKSRFIVDFIIIILYEKQKLEKLKMMFLGIRDGLKNKYGKFDV